MAKATRSEDCGEATRCPYCRIVAGYEPASVVFADELFVAFMDHRPVSTGHTIIATRGHAHYLDEMDPVVGKKLLQWIHRLADSMRAAGIADDGTRFFLSDGELEYTDIAHVHAHVFPHRTTQAHTKCSAVQAFPLSPRAELDAVAANLCEVVHRAANTAPVPSDIPAGHASVFLPRIPRTPTGGNR